MTPIEKRNAELATLRRHVDDEVEKVLHETVMERFGYSGHNMRLELIRMFRLGFAAASAVLNGDCVLGCHEKATIDGVCQSCHDELYNSIKEV